MSSAAATVVQAPAWLTDFYVNVDACDVAPVLAGFADDATMIYGANDPLVGRDEIRGGLEWLFTCYSRMRHQFLNIWTRGPVVLLEANVTYFWPDGRHVTVPALTILEHHDGVIDNLRIFIDPTPTRVG